MEDANEQPGAGTEPTAGAEPEPTTPPAAEPKPHRPTLSDEEQLAVLEGRAQRLRTKLGKGEPAQPQPADDLAQKGFLRSAGIKDQDEVDLALTTAKKWGMPIDKIVDDEDFLAKLDKLRTQKANDLAASGVRGAPGSNSGTQLPEFYIARGTPPSREEVPNRAARADIVRKMTASKNHTGQFYNS